MINDHEKYMKNHQITNLGRIYSFYISSNHLKQYLAILLVTCFGMVSSRDLQLGNKKITLNHLGLDPSLERSHYSCASTP